MTSVNDRLDLLIDLRRFADAETAAREAIGRDPQWAPGYTQLARALIGQNKPEAIDAAREGARKAPHDAWAVCMLACALNNFSRYTEALEVAEQAVKLNPRYTWVRAILANVLFNLNRFQDTRDQAVEGLQFDPLSESLIRWKGWAEHKLGQNAEALATAEAGLKHHPNSHQLLNLMGSVKWVAAEQTWGRTRLQLHREADAILRESIRLDPTCAAYRDNLRGNALSCRASIVTPLIVTVYFLSCVVPVAAIGVMVLLRGPSAPAGLAVVAGLVITLALGALAPSERGALAFPLNRLRVPVVPLPPRDRQLAQYEFAAYLLLWLAPYSVSLLAFL